jgi:hypothetical protein
MSNKITDEQILAAFDEHQDRTKAAESLNCSYDFYRKRLKKVLYVPPAEQEGFSVIETNTFENADGEARFSWVRRRKDKEEQENALRAFVDGLTAKIKPVKPNIEIPKTTLDKLVQYTISDMHIGEAIERLDGTKYEIEDAVDIVDNFVDYSIATTPKYKYALFANAGDWTHWDGHIKQTRRNKHPLEGSCSLEKLAYESARLSVRSISKLLNHHEIVYVSWSSGNHDDELSTNARAWLKVYYENEPRVVILESTHYFSHLRFGKSLLVFTHGHMAKRDGQLAAKIVREFRSIYSELEYIYIHTGHYHTYKEDFSNNLAWLIQHPTLGEKGDYAKFLALDGDRMAVNNIYDKEHGKVNDNFVKFKMIG